MSNSELRRLEKTYPEMGYLLGKLADAIENLWDNYWSGESLSDQRLVDAILEHIRNFK